MGEFGKMIREWRQKKHISIGKCGRACRISATTWKNIENGISDKPSWTVAQKISEFTGIPVTGDLVHFKPPEITCKVNAETKAYIEATIKWRYDNNVKLSEYCRAIGVVPTQIRRYEYGIRRYPPKVMEAIEAFTGIKSLSPMLQKDEHERDWFISDEGDTYEVINITPRGTEVLFHTDEKKRANEAYTKIVAGGALVRMRVKLPNGTRTILRIFEAEKQFKRSEFIKTRSISR